MALNAKIVGLVDKGIICEKNDDRLLVEKTIIDSGVYSTVLSTPFHCAICDGVGGESRGNEAAEFVLRQLSNEKINNIDTADKILCVLSQINNNLLDYQKREQSNGMKTTIVGLGIYEDKVIIYNAGDSRLYRLRNDNLVQLSEDHSTAHEMIMMGLITDNIDEELMKCSRITRCLGTKTSAIPYVKQINMHALKNDMYLLCSDGLWGAVVNDDITRVLKSENSLEEKVQLLFEMAENNGSSDNISIAIIEIE